MGHVSSWLSQLDHRTTSFNTVCNNWKIAHTPSRDHMGDADIQISEDGSTITITWAHVSGMEVDTELWSKLVRDDVRSLWSGIEGVIPKEAVQGLQDFDAGQLVDDPLSDKCIFDHPANVGYLLKFQNEVLQSLVGCHMDDVDVNIDLDTVNKFLKALEELRAHLMSALVHSSGVPPRAFQLACLLFRNLNGLSQRHRNLRKWKDDWLYGNVVAKQDGRQEYAAYWLMCPEVSRACAYLFGVLRPVEEYLLDHFRFAEAWQFHHYMFVKAPILEPITRPNSSESAEIVPPQSTEQPEATNHENSSSKMKQATSVYTETDVNDVLRRWPGLGLEIRAERQVDTAIIKRYYPSLHNGRFSLLSNT